MEQKEQKKALDIPRVAELAKRLARPVAVLDLETNGLGGDSFGITEIAVWRVDPDGKQKAFQTLVNPQAHYPLQTQLFTGIPEAWTLQAAPFSRWGPLMREVMERCVCVGFNSRVFDLPGLCSQMIRYRVGLPADGLALDLRDAWRGIHLPERGRGKLSTLSEHYDCRFHGAHRAMADTMATTRILNAMIEQHGLDEVERFVVHSHEAGRAAPAPELIKIRRKEKPALLARIKRDEARAAREVKKSGAKGPRA